MVEYHHKGTVRSGVHRQILHTCDLWSRIFQRDGTQQRLIFRINFVDVISSANVDFLCFLSKAPLYLLISLFLPTMAMAIDPPERELSRFALKTNYLQSPDEGVYELAFDNASKKVFAAVTDRVNREANKGYLYSFNSDSLKVENKYTMPYRAFSLAINQDKHTDTQGR